MATYWAHMSLRDRRRYLLAHPLIRRIVEWLAFQSPFHNPPEYGIVRPREDFSSGEWLQYEVDMVTAAGSRTEGRREHGSLARHCKQSVRQGPQQAV